MALSFSFFFAPLISSPPALCRYLFPILVLFLFSSVKQQLSSSCFVRATAVIFFVLLCPRNRYLFLFSTYVVLLAAFPFLSDLLASQHLSFVLLCFIFFFSFFLSLSFFHGLNCFVVFSYSVRQHFTRFTVMNCDCLVYSVSVCHHKNCISLG